MNRIWLIIWMTALCGEGWGQSSYRSLRNYTAIDGLPQSQVEAIVEDPNGYLWVGTQGGGLARFDGRHFKVYTTLDGLLTNFISALQFDDDNNLWILHPRGVTKFDGLKFTRFLSPQSRHSYYAMRNMFIDGDTLFLFSADNQLSKISGDSVYYWNEPIVKGGVVLNAHQATGGEMIFYVSNGDFLVLKDGERFLIKPEGKKRFYNMFNRGDDVCVRADDGTYKMNLQTHRLEPLDVDVPHFVLMHDSKEDVYWTRDRNTLYRDQFEEGAWSTDTILTEISVNKVIEDAEGGLWFATNGRGLYKYFFQDFTRCGSEKLRGVMSIEVDSRGNTWLGTMENGLWRINKGKTRSYTDELGIYRSSVHKVAESPAGDVWVSTGKGLGRYVPEHDNFRWYSRQDGLGHDNVMNFDFDDKGGMWLGTVAGVDYFDGRNFKHFNVNDGLSSNMIWSLCYMESAGTLFTGTEMGINSIRGDKVGYVSLPELENTMIFSLNTYRDSLLIIGSGGSGIALFNPATYEKKFFTTHDGLTSDFVYFVAADDDDRIWIGTEKGITLLRLNDRLEIVENLHFDYDNGLTGMETNQNAFYLGKDVKYFGLIDGVYQYNDVNEDSARSFDLHLTDVEVLYGAYSARDYSDSLKGFFKIPVKPKLPPDRNHITFHFNRVDKQYPKSVKFRYFLQNFDKTWSKPSSSTQVTYSNLPAGSYVFRVMATDNNGSWSGTKVSYAFTVQAPFYQTASFITGVIIFLAGSITLLLYLRVRQRVRKMIDTERIRMQELESLRKDIARDFHDEMGNQLTRIINYVSLLKLNGHDHAGANGSVNGKTKDSRQDLYKKVEESAKFLYTGTRDFIWSIDPVNDELSKLFIHIRDFGEKLFEEKNISFRAFDEVKEPIKLPNGFSREANLIFKEVMTNAFKYSNAHNVTLTLRRNTDRFEMVFEDDGIGFDIHTQENANGLKNIRHRAERIGAVLRIRSGTDLGTLIILDFKLTKKVEYGPAF